LQIRPSFQPQYVIVSGGKLPPDDVSSDTGIRHHGFMCFQVRS
jgi:hypothetical protein